MILDYQFWSGTRKEYMKQAETLLLCRTYFDSLNIFFQFSDIIEILWMYLVHKKSRSERSIEIDWKLTLHSSCKLIHPTLSHFMVLLNLCTAHIICMLLYRNSVLLFLYLAQCPCNLAYCFCIIITSYKILILFWGFLATLIEYFYFRWADFCHSR